MGRVKGVFGTRIRGKVGDVVFRVVNGGTTVSQKPDKVHNPKTEAQQRQRMVFTTVTAAYSAMKGICDHSFENKSKGSECQNFFMKQNLTMMRQKTYNFNIKGNSFMMPNPLLISKGSIPSSPYDTMAEEVEVGGISGTAVAYNNALQESETLTTLTVGRFHEIIGAKVGDQITVCSLNFTSENPVATIPAESFDISQYPSTFDYARIVFNPDTESEVLIDSGVINRTLLDAERSENANYIGISVTAQNLLIGCVFKTSATASGSAAIIISRKDDASGKWLRSTQFLTCNQDEASAISTDANVIESYTPNAEYYLNNALL